MKISVAMAAYNGEGYIIEQLTTILNQLGESDEVIVSIDPCKDNTLNVVRALSELDDRVKPLEGEGKGLIKNFENAIRHCTGDTLSEREQNLFVRRYFFSEPIKVIADRYDMSENSANVMLSRVRKRLRSHLSKEGYFDE